MGIVSLLIRYTVNDIKSFSLYIRLKTTIIQLTAPFTAGNDKLIAGRGAKSLKYVSTILQTIPLFHVDCP